MISNTPFYAVSCNKPNPLQIYFLEMMGNSVPNVCTYHAWLVVCYSLRESPTRRLALDVERGQSEI
jgi:hypothetical protein